MSKTYVIGDLHGRFDLLIKAFDAINAYDKPFGNAKIITLGDYIDRGPESSQIIEQLTAIQKCSDYLMCLKGNHEDIMWQTCRKLPYADWWLSNGGFETLLSYGHPTTGPINLKVIPDDHLHWAWSLPLMHVDKHRVYVHAWVDSSVPLDKQDPEKVIWELYPHNANYGHRQSGKHVVHGHHQFENGPLLRKGRTDLDTFAWYTGRLVIGVFDGDIPGGPIDLIEINGEPYAGRKWAR